MLVSRRWLRAAFHRGCRHNYACKRPGSGDFARDYDSVARSLSAQFVWLNRSKESLTLDINHPEAQAILERLLASADVFVQNLAPGVADRLGLGADALAQRYPRLIVCDISGYGVGGSYQDKKAYDLLIQAETGLLSLTGTPEAPAKVGISIADISAGMYAYSGILTALYQRERTGQGTALSVSLFDALGEWLTYPAYFAAYGGAPPPRSGSNHATIAPYGPFDGIDGQVYLAVQNEREWARFCEIVIERPELRDDPRFNTNSRRVAQRDALHAAVGDAFGTLTIGEIVERLERAQIAYARMNTMQEF